MNSVYCYHCGSDDGAHYPKCQTAASGEGVTLQQALGLSDADVDRISRDLAACSGSVDDDGLRVEFYGACPVEGRGVIDGLACYYRSRWGEWSFEVFGQTEFPERHPWPDPIWRTESENFGECDDAPGWERAEVTARLIRQAAASFRAEKQLARALGGGR